MMEVNLPIIICGKHVDAEGRSALSLPYETGITLNLPEVTDADVSLISSSTNRELHQLPVSEVIDFYARVGALWANKDYPLRQEATKLAAKVTGYDEIMIDQDMELISDLIRTRAYLGDVLDTELGNRQYLDEWIPFQNVYRHAQPRGHLLHVMVGNVPIASVFTMVRGGLAKNTTIAKLPQRDPITALFFAMSFQDVDPSHPITKTTSVMFWKGGSPAEDKFLKFSDAVCVWGGKTSVEAIKKKVPASVEFIEFGPKRSLSLIGREANSESERVARGIAHDMSVYNQEACFCPQNVYIESDKPIVFAEALSKALAEYTTILPKGYVSIDNHSHVSLVRLMAQMRGNHLICPDDTDWTIIITDDKEPVSEHPLSRTIYLHSVNDLTEALPYINGDVQTIGIWPWNRSKEICEAFTLAGASRFSPVGDVGHPRLGWGHDGIYPLNRMVRWVSVERDWDYNCRIY